MDCYDLIKTILAKKLNNDIAEVIMKRYYQTTMEMVFEKVCEIDNVHAFEITTDIKKDEEFTGGEMFFSTTDFADILPYYRSYLKNNLMIDNYKKFDQSLFVIKKNKILLKKGEMICLHMAEITKIIGTAVITTSNKYYNKKLEVGDILLTKFLCYDDLCIYAVVDTYIYFDYYIASTEFEYKFNKLASIINGIRLGDIIYHPTHVIIYNKKNLNKQQLHKWNVPENLWETNRDECRNLTKLIKYIVEKLQIPKPPWVKW